MSVHLPNVHTSSAHQYVLPYVIGALGASAHLSDISVSVSTSIVHHFNSVIPVAQHHCGSLAVSCMDGFSTFVFWVLFFLFCWTGVLWMYAQATCC